MKHLLPGTLIPGALAIAGIVAVLLWTGVGPTERVGSPRAGARPARLG